MPAADPNGPLGPIPDGPYSRGFAISPHDTNELAFVTNALLAYTTAGTCVVVTQGGDTITVYLDLGIPVKVRARVVKTTGTAAGITGLY